MSDAGSTRLPKTSLEFAQERVRGMARQIGVHLVMWGNVKVDMVAAGIEELDLMQALQNCEVSAREVLGEVERFEAQGLDADERRLNIRFVMCAERHAIEIVRVSLEGM